MPRLHMLMFSAMIAIASASAANPLIDAVKRGNPLDVSDAIRGGANVNLADADGSTPLHWAVYLERPEIAGALLQAGAKVSAVTRYNVPVLALAAENGNTALIETLLAAGADANATSEEGQTMLMTAARNGKVDAIRALLRSGAKLNATEGFKNQTALMFAAGEGNTKAAEMLLEFGAELKAKSKAGYTAFLFAVRNNHPETAKFLLEHGANVNDALPDGTTALHLAALNADYDLGAILLDAGANPNLRDPRGTPIHTVVWLHKPGAPPDFAMSGLDPQPTPRPSGRLSEVDMLKKLLAKGADPNARVDWKEGRFTPGGGLSRNPPLLQIGRHYLTYNGATPFYLAARNGDIEMMKVLAAAGADPKATNKIGVTPLMAAACMDYYEGETAGPFSGVPESERLEAVKFAVQLGNDVNARTTEGKYVMKGTPEATLLRYPDNIQDLLDLEIGDMRFAGMTPLHGAVICNQPSIVQYLIDQGAKVDARNQLGWTPLLVSRGLYIANNRKDFPAAENLIRKALTTKGLPVN